jgi:hypothetical protein
MCYLPKQTYIMYNIEAKLRRISWFLTWQHGDAKATKQSLRVGLDGSTLCCRAPWWQRVAIGVVICCVPDHQARAVAPSSNTVALQCPTDCSWSHSVGLRHRQAASTTACAYAPLTQNIHTQHPHPAAHHEPIMRGGAMTHAMELALTLTAYAHTPAAAAVHRSPVHPATAISTVRTATCAHTRHPHIHHPQHRHVSGFQ